MKTIRKHPRLFAVSCTVLGSAAMLALILTAAALRPAHAAIPASAAPRIASAAVDNVTAGYPVFGNTQIVVSGSGAANALNLASSAAAAGTSSTPCNNVLIYTSTSAPWGPQQALIGTGSGNCTFPLSAGLQTLPFPITNLNQVWIASAGTGTVTVSAAYAQ